MNRKNSSKVKEKRSTITREAWERLVKKKRGQAQDVIYEIMSGNKFPEGDWETQVGIIFENRIRKDTKDKDTKDKDTKDKDTKDKDEYVIYQSTKHIRALLKKSLEFMDDYFSKYKHPPFVPPLPPPEKYKAFLDSPLFSRKELSRGK